MIRVGRTGLTIAVVVGLFTGACSASTQGGPAASSSLTATSSRTSSQSPSPSPSVAVGKYSLGHFPDVPTGSFPASTRTALRAILDAAVEGGLPGITATVMTADGQAWSGAAGTADGVNPVQVRSQFAIASITKTVIAAEIMWLSEKGRLRLSDPISKHLPANFHFDTNGATIENLLSMESGIPDPTFSEASAAVLANPLRNWTAEQVLATVPSYRSTPGDHFVYEDANYMLLGLVVQQVTGMSVAAALRAHILADPRLGSMVYQTQERPKGPLALPFLGGDVRPNIVKVGGGYLPTKAEASGPSGSGGMASDSGALALWGYLLFGRHLLTEKSLQAMTDFGTGTAYDRYGLGVFDQTNLAEGFGAQSVGNAGRDNGGYSTALCVLPSQGIVISVMTNTGGDPVILVIPTAQKLASVLDG